MASRREVLVATMRRPGVREFTVQLVVGCAEHAPEVHQLADHREVPIQELVAQSHCLMAYEITATVVPGDDDSGNLIVSGQTTDQDHELVGGFVSAVVLAAARFTSEPPA